MDTRHVDLEVIWETANRIDPEVGQCCGRETWQRLVARSSRNWPGPWPKTPGRLLGTAFVRLYQLTLSGFVGNSCRHLPTCSEYAHEAIARHGLWAGGWMALFRVMRCGPGGTHGSTGCPKCSRRAFAGHGAIGASDG